MNNDLRAGRVVPVLQGFNQRSVDLNLISPIRKLITPAVLLLRDLLREKALSSYHNVGAANKAHKNNEFAILLNLKAI